MNDLRRVDLNLLVILDALLAEAHVSRAAARLGLSQPAASSALDRLRHLFGNPLLERSRGGMRLTPEAEALRPRLQIALAGIRAVLGTPAPDLATATRTVRFLMADALAAVLVADLLRSLAAAAPGVTVAVLPWQGATDAVEMLRRNEADLVLSVLPRLPPEFRQVPLTEEHYQVAMRRDHPAASSFSLDAWLAHPHVVVSGRGEAATPLDTGLAELGYNRRVGAVVPSFLMVPPLLLRTNLIATLPQRCVAEDGGLACFPPPVPVPGFQLDLAWHERRDGDMVVRHVADEVVRLIQAGNGAASTAA